MRLEGTVTRTERLLCRMAIGVIVTALPIQPSAHGASRPVAAEPVAVRLQLPAGFRARSVRFLSPDDPAVPSVEFNQRGTTIEFRAPGFLVYGVCVIEQ